ncbi:MAG: hypothetical protein ACLTC3_13710 [Evtepia gabavorous]
MEELKVLQSKLKAQLPDLELREQEPMRLHTTFRVGGPASLMALPRREADLGQLLRMAFQAGVTPFFLGKGSNLLVADEGVDRFLIKLAGASTGWSGRRGPRSMWAAGLPWPRRRCLPPITA